MFNSLHAPNGGGKLPESCDCWQQIAPLESEAAVEALVLDNSVSVPVLDKAPGDRNEVPEVRDLIASPGWDLLSN